MQQPLCNRKTLNEIELEIGNSRLDSLAWLLRFFPLSLLLFVSPSIFQFTIVWTNENDVRGLSFPWLVTKPPFLWLLRLLQKPQPIFNYLDFQWWKLIIIILPFPPEFQCVQSNLGGKWEKKKNQRRKIIWDPIWREETLRFVNPQTTRTSLVFFYRQNRVSTVSIFLQRNSRYKIKILLFIPRRCFMEAGRS